MDRIALKISISLLCVLFLNQVKAQDIFINELMSDNESTIQALDGEYYDWIELYNKSNQSVSLLNYSLSDDIENPYKWSFPDIIIPSNGYLLVFASGNNILDITELHCNFKISSSGEEVFLSDNNNTLIDHSDSINIAEDYVYERYPDGSENWIITSTPTPGETNNLNNQLNFSSYDGFHNSPFYLQITSLSEDNIYYTLDGSIPVESSNLYSDSIFINYKDTAPNFFSEIPTSPDQSLISYKAWESPEILIDKANIIRCATYKNGIRTSRIYSQTYFVIDDIFNKYNTPVISLITDSENLFNNDSGIYVPGIHWDPEDPAWTGNYFQDGIEWEKPVHVEYYKSNGELGFSQDAGMRIHGFLTRHAAQKSLKLYARNEYGSKYFNYQLLPQKDFSEYKRILLQTTMGSWGANTIIKDVLAHEIARNLNIESQDFQPVVVFVNGEYWGIHTLRDRIDERYIEYTNGYDKDSVDIIKGNLWLVQAGSNEHYIDLAEFIELNDLSNTINYEFVKTQIDINSFIDYQIAEMFFSNKDWPGNNQKLWRPQTQEGKWRWIFFDIDAGFGNHTTNMIEHSLMVDRDLTWQYLPVSTFLFRNLLENEEFINHFIHRYEELLNNDFKTSIMLSKLEMIKALYQEEVPEHISRWNYPSSYYTWEQDLVNDLSAFLEKRPCAAKINISDYFNLEDFDLDCELFTDISDSLILAPNPGKETFFIMNNSSRNFLGNISISDIRGKRIYSETYLFMGGGAKQYFNLEGLSSGIYILRLDSKYHVANKKLIIIN